MFVKQLQWLHFSRGQAFLSLMHRRKVFGKQLSPTCWSWGECPHFVVRIHRSVGEMRLSSCDKLKDFNMFCSLLSTCQMSYKSIPCQWSVHVPQLIFKQLSALLSPGYSDSKLCLSAC